MCVVSSGVIVGRRIDAQTWSKIGKNEAILLEEKIHLSILHKYTDRSIISNVKTKIAIILKSRKYDDKIKFLLNYSLPDIRMTATSSGHGVCLCVCVCS